MKEEKSLVEVVQETGLEQNQAQAILNDFTGLFENARGWEEKAHAISVTSEDQLEEMRQARQARLALKEIRVDAEKTRKRLKEKALREGKAIDGIANIIKALVVPLEEHLEQQEKFAEIQEQARKEKKLAERKEKLGQYVPDVSVYILEDMTDESFDTLLRTSKEAHEAKIAAEKKADEDRIAKEKAEREEQERIRQENEKLRKEAEEQERKAEEERKKMEAKRKAEREKAEAAQRKEEEKRKAAEAKLKAQRDAERKAKREAQEAERKKKEEEAEAKRQADLAPEKDKLVAYKNKLVQVALTEEPPGLSAEGRNIVQQSKNMVDNIASYILKEIENL